MGVVRPALAALLLVVSPGQPGAAAQAVPRQSPPAAAGQTAPLDIEHQPPACVVAGKYARLNACFRPPAALARARVYFRGGGTRDWFYVEMGGQPPCLQALLPRPKKQLTRIEYYISATDRRSGESRTKESQLVVSADGQCTVGPLAPVVESGSVVIGSATGAAPVGFVTGGGVSPLLIAGGVAVVGGGAAAVIAGGGGGEPAPATTTTSTTTTSTTTTVTTTTTTTTTLLPPTPTTTTTTTLAPCESPNQDPVANIVAPSTGSLSGLSVEVQATASDPAPGSGIREVRFTYQYCPSNVCGSENVIGTDTTGPSPYTIIWTFPSCAVAPDIYFRIIARAVDNCGNISAIAPVSVALIGRCFRADAVRADAPRPDAGSWMSDLQAPAGRGQVVVDGSQVVFPSAGTESYATPLAPGPHRFEATLVDGSGRGGLWRFDLAALGLAPGSLRVVAGEAVQVGADTVVFRLRGRPGERVVFGFRVGGE
jgi:hypothetical protein